MTNYLQKVRSEYKTHLLGCQYGLFLQDNVVNIDLNFEKKGCSAFFYTRQVKIQCSKKLLQEICALGNYSILQN